MTDVKVTWRQAVWGLIGLPFMAIGLVACFIWICVSTGWLAMNRAFMSTFEDKP